MTMMRNNATPSLRIRVLPGTLFVAGTLSVLALPSFARAAEVPFASTPPISTAADGAVSVAAADLDGDGDLDTLSASSLDAKLAWYENADNTNPGTSWVLHTISTTVLGAHSVAVGDVDGDGDLDALSASRNDDTIAAYLNPGTPATSWTLRTISTTAMDAFSVAVGDVDGDGDLDALSASRYDDKIAWYENADNTNPGTSWVIHTISTTADGAASVQVGDVDGDGDLDALSSSFFDDKVAWYENADNSNPGASWVLHTIATDADGIISVSVGDIDGDGDLDAISASYFDSTAAWYENPGPNGTTWVPHAISTNAGEPFSVAVGDMDEDGDLDAVSASRTIDTIAWHENVSTPPGTSWVQRTISTSADGAYAVVVADLDGSGDLDILSASVFDDTVAWYRSDATIVNLVASPTLASEAGATPVTLQARVSSPVTNAQTVDLAVTGAGITSDDYVLSTTTLHIPDGATQGAVSFTVVDDPVDEGQETAILTIGNPSAGIRLGLTPSRSISITDDDTAGILVAPTAGLSTTESDGQDQFTVRLTSQPVANVNIAVASSDLSEGAPSTGGLTFTPSNWSLAQTVTLTGVNDVIPDGDVGYTVLLGPVSTSDPLHAVIDPADVSVTNRDNDSASVDVGPACGPYTTETGGTARFTVVLNTPPSHDVVIQVASSNPTEGTPGTANLTFTPGNWHIAQTVTVTGVDDAVADGDSAYPIQLGPITSLDPVYAAIDPDDVALINQDNDTAGATVTPTCGLTTTESGGIAQFTAVLNTPPAADVVIPLSSNNATEGVSPASITFTPLNWNTVQTVTVTGVDDAVEDGNVPYTIVLSPIIGPASGYDAIDPIDVRFINLENDITCRGLVATRFGTIGHDSITGTAGRDVIAGRGGNDHINGGGGNDLICGDTANDRIVGGGGNDRLEGGTGRDHLDGGAGRDRVVGGAGRDNLKGGPGRDRAEGGSGGDRLNGGSGRDRCLGGPGRDAARSCERTSSIP